MRNVTRWLLAGVLTLTPLAGVVGTASANTELVPAARLVAPYWDVRGGVDTFLMLTNVSNVDLMDDLGVHLEFYDKTCTRVNETINLSAYDIDQLQLTVKPLIKGVLASDFGWIDIDVRSGGAGQNDPSVERNHLLGTVIIVDGTKDFAIAYPMASSIGSSSSGTYGGTIVTRDDTTTGAALAWTGTFEPYPGRLFVPMFIADGTDAASGQVFSTSLYVAPVANGNWAGASVAIGSGGEAPGQALGSETLCTAATACALDLAIDLWDGCEESASAPKKAHYFQGTLTGLFTAQRADRVNWTAAKCDPEHSGLGSYAGLDEYSGAPTGWIDIRNTTAETTTGEASSKRGMVGVLVGTVINTGNQFGDATRLWGDPEYSGRDGIYTQVDEVDMNLLVD